MTKPSAPSAYGRVPVAESAPILQNFTNVEAPMLRSMPPVTATSKSLLDQSFDRGADGRHGGGAGGVA